MFRLAHRAWFWGVVAIGCALLVVPWGAVAQTSSPWSWGPHLGAVSPDSAAISWDTSRPVAIDLHYGLARVYDLTGVWEETLTLDRHEGTAEIWLRDLLADEAYRYQVVVYEGDAVFPSEIGTFFTPTATLRSFSFAVYGGTNALSDRHRLVASTIAEEGEGRPVFHLGDLIDASAADPLASTFWAIGDLARSHPFLPIVGNLDTGQAAFFDAFALPAGGGTAQEEWWSLDYGGIHIIALSSSAASSGMAQQLEWLEQDLAAAEGQIIVVLTHEPIYSSAYEDGVNETLQNAWENLFKEHGVRLVISGDTNWYEHVYVGGIHHITSGGGGGPLADPANQAIPGTVFQRARLLHYLRFTVADDALRVEAIPVASVSDDVVLLVPSGRSVDSFVLRPTP